MIECRKYTDRDFEEIKSWYDKRGIAIEMENIPKTGFIVPGIAAGFIMKTDTKCCIFEPFISRPYSLRSERDVALDSIFEELLKEAKNLGFTKAFGFSTCIKMVWRAQSFGFKIIETNSLTVCKDL